MRKSIRSPAGSLVPGLVFITASVFATSCFRTSSSADGPISRDLQAIDSLKVAGLYDEALRRTEHLAVLTDRPGTRPWQAVESGRLSETLSRIVSLPPESRRELAEADRLTPVIRKLMEVDGNYIAATDAATRQLELRSRLLGHDHPDVALSLDLLGQITHRAGQKAGAEEYFRNALEIQRARLGPNHPRVAETLVHWGDLHKELHQPAEAESSYLRALSILESTQPKDDPSLAPALQALGSIYRSWQRFHLAEPLYRRALHIRRLTCAPRSIPIAENLLWLGFCQLCAGKLDAAEESLAEAREIFREQDMDLSHDMGNVTWFLGMSSWLRDDCAGAISLWRESFRCWTNAPADHPQGYGQVRLRGLDGEWIDALLCEGKEEEAWKEVCRGSGPVAQSILNLSSARKSSMVDSDRLDALRAEFLATRRRLTDAEASGATEASMDSIRVQLARVDANRMMLEQSFVTRFPGASGDSLTLDRIQSAMKPNQAMIGWITGKWAWQGRSRKWSIWAFVLRRHGSVQWVHLGDWRNVQDYRRWSESFTQFDKALMKSSQWPHRVSPDPWLNALALDAGKKAFSPLLPYLDGVEELIVIDGQLTPLWPTNIFPECLLDSQGVPTIGRFAFCYAPSPAVFVHLVESSGTGQPVRERSVIAVADPVGDEESPSIAAVATDSEVLLRAAAGTPGPTVVNPALFRGVVSRNREAIARLPRLPNSRGEVLKVASIFHRTSVLMGQGATKTRLESALEKDSNLGVLHLATHTLIDEVEPGRSSFVMSQGDQSHRDEASIEPPEDGLVTADDVLLSWKLNADLVTLSGCQTNLGFQARGGEILGFAQAFLAAGARSLLMSRWKVDDLATALLMGRFYENLAGSYQDARGGPVGAPMNKARALQEAQLWLRDVKDPDGNTPFAHPIYWAGFVLMGSPE